MNDCKAPAFEQLQAELIYQMNRYSGRPDAGTADAIAVLLQGILTHPLIELFPELRCQCARGLNDWRARASAGMSTATVSSTASLH